ncbi:uncharacterized protein TNCT_326201 [Trichonephila clavata]|uniref:Uncharacterized protein n=1 Tax=Trichonephila clavata TaxID=2740835 RepID=A0A8X6HT32_TRICU|nr:uncharacterized protein TNCT_326201 [Trichonephila clavata]
MTSIEEPGSQVGDNCDQSINMEDVSVTPPLSDEERCATITGFEKQSHIFDARKDYVVNMLEIERKIPSPTTKTRAQLEDELKNLEDKIKFLEVENTIRQINTTNSFAALNTAKTDAEDVTPPQTKVKPIMMRMTTSYNLILQSINRTHPTATNTHINGFIKIVAETEDHHREITEFLTAKKMQYYVIDPIYSAS